MLLFQPPFLEVENLTIFKDDKDPHTYYYTVVQPEILINEGIPSLSGYAIIPESGTTLEVESIVDAGLSFEVGLKASAETLERAKEIIKETFKKEAHILAPAPVVDGEVYLTLAQAGESPEAKEWFISSGVSPSLFGENRAALAINTDGENAKHLTAALREGVVAGMVFYKLNILGIAPVFRARMHVKWDKVYHHLEEFKTQSFFFVKEEISKAVDDLKETSAIEVIVEELDPDVKNFAIKSLFEELKSQVIKRLFQPSTPPLSTSKKWENRLVSGFSRLVSSLLPGSLYQLVQVDETQLFETTIDLNESKAKKYPFHPQALLSSMIARVEREHQLTHPNWQQSEWFKWIELDKMPFLSDEVVISLAADTFNTSNIKSVKIDCRVRDLTLDEVVEEVTLVFDSVENLRSQFRYTRKKDHEYVFEYTAAIFLDASSDSALPSRLEIDWQESKSKFIYFNAAEYFEPYNINIAIDDNSIFEQTQLIEAVFTVTERPDEDEPKQLSAPIPVIRKTFIFKPEDAASKVFSFLSARTVPLKISLTLGYYLPNAQEHFVTVDDLQDDYVFIANPFENRWSVDLISAVNWTKTLKVITEIRVWDVARSAYITEKFSFTERQNGATFYCVSSLETPAQKLEVRYNVIGIDASITRSRWTPQQGAILVVKDQIKAERTIKAKLTTAPDFEQKEIKKAYIEFKYEDAKNDIDVESERLYFEALGDEVNFTHPMPDFTVLEYEYRVKVSSESGDRYKTKWITAIQDEIDIELPDDMW